MGCKKQGAKNQGHCYSKKEEAFFLNNNDPVFCTLLFATHILDLFLKDHKPTNVLKTKID